MCKNADYVCWKFKDAMAKSKKTGEVKIYGDIFPYGYNSAAGFIERFEAARVGADEMNIHLHTDGGDVSEGTLIYNHIKSCDIPVNIYIDGVCCSMGTVIMLAADRVYMCENSYLMVHAPQGSCYGTASIMEKTVKGLRGMEKNFKKIYAAKTGRSEKEVEGLLDGDNWFTAQEALDAKLIDGIVEPIATDVTPVSARELKMQTPTALYNRFSACLKAETEKGDKAFSDNHIKQSEMDKEDLIRKFGLTGVTAESTDKEVEDAIQAKLDAEKQRADNAESKVEEAENKRITDVVEAAFKGGKIAAAQKEVYVAIGKKNGSEALSTVLDGMKAAPSLIEATRGGVQLETSAVRTAWTWEQWQKEDPRGLEKMSREEPEKFEALYKSAFK